MSPHQFKEYHNMSSTSISGVTGKRTSGEDVRAQNVTSCLAIANIVKTSLGPLGLDKMLVDEIGDVLITNDGATILQQLDVEHPAAKVLVDLAGLQDQEVGDGTTSVVIVAAELLKRANELVKNKIHPTNIMAGYRLALKQSVKFIKEELSLKEISDETILNAAKTSLSSKVLGNTGSDFWAQMCVDAIKRVKRKNYAGKDIYPVKAVNILKAHGKSMKESTVVNGFALNCVLASEAMPQVIEGAKIACVDFNLNKARLAMGIQVLLDDPGKLEDIKKRELDIAKERVEMLMNAGANVILTTKGIDDLVLKYMVERGVMGVRRVKKDDLKRIARITGGSLVLSLATLEGDEGFDPECLGEADKVEQAYVSDDRLIIIEGCKNTRASSVILRGPNSMVLDEMERSLHDAMCIVQRSLESGRVVPGGGAVEAALSVYLESFARTLSSREQLAIAEFADALLVIPKTLSVNAAQDSADMVANLLSKHTLAQSCDDGDDDKKYMRYGLDLIEGDIVDNVERGVLEPAISKVKSLQFATEAAITILRIDDLIELQSQQAQDGGYPGM
eukprot:TRINITY_DN1438_c0_g5_i2.p1 TRINITY_DN1438_c0_g5~~TRINITY_DN1438_c0_g5_i2.p1  ORF type:complete len:562 (-),score=224.94 TRINITY_DN1438_c0_g5_i2:42-1727(-)